MERGSSIYVAGHLGLAGSALVRTLNERGFSNLLLRSRSELELTDQAAVRAFFAANRPEYVLMAAGRTGGIAANIAHPAEFISANLEIQSNLILAARDTGARKVLFIACSCIYPRDAAQPIREDSLLTGPVEPTSEAFALAKIAGLKLCSALNTEAGTRFVAVVPPTLYGPNDNFDLENSHFLSAFIVRFHRAKLEAAPEVQVWGSGRPERELMYVDDFADGCLELLARYDGAEHINIGAGRGISIREAAELVKRVVGYQGSIAFDRSKPDGAPRKVLDAGRIGSLGWRPRVSLEIGLRKTYNWYLSSYYGAQDARAPAL